MDTFRAVVGAPVHWARKESRHRLPLRRIRRRALHSANVRRGTPTPPGKIAGFHHGTSLAGSRRNVWMRGFGLCQQMVGLPVYVPDTRQSFWPD